MSRLLFVSSIVLLLAACQSSSLDKTYDPNLYKAHYKMMVGDEQVGPQEVFLINYAIARHRDYLGYSIEGKSYGDILEMARGFQQNGLGIAEEYQQNGQAEGIEVKVFNEGQGLVRKSPNSSRMLKILKFECTYTNSTDKDMALESSSFILKGPFGQHLSTVGYELNCLIPAGQSLKAYYLLDGREIRKTLNFGRKKPNTYLGIEILFPSIDIVPSGNSVTTENAELYNDCLFDGRRAEPFAVYDYSEQFEKDNPSLSQKSGKAEKINYGNAHFILEESDEPLNASELGRR
ncbi:MAG: hypothetical protein AAFV95_15555 [Bacteroidota bacterium]